MKLSVLVWFGALGLLGMGAGCEHINITPEGNPERVLTGVVSLHSVLLQEETHVTFLAPLVVNLIC